VCREGRGVTVMARESGVDSRWAVQGPDASWAARSWWRLISSYSGVAKAMLERRRNVPHRHWSGFVPKAFMNRFRYDR